MMDMELEEMMEKRRGESTGILYKKDKVKKVDGGTFWLSPIPDVPTFGWCSQKRRSVTWGIFELISNKQRFCYINTHLDLVAQARTESMKMLKSKFKELNPNCYPQILTADFNTISSDAIFDDFKKEMGNSRNYAPTNKTDDSGTYNNWGKEKSNKEIDMIFSHLIL
jgi:Endonuclease/Exonuclease/phosphatase family.